MSLYAQQLQLLHQAIVHGETAAAGQVIAPARADAITVRERLDAYTGGYAARLIQATRVDYPALAHYMGDETLHQHLDAFVRQTPSMQWDLNRYSPAFAHYLAKHCDDPAAVALAQLEACIADVYWLPDSVPLESMQASANLETLASMRFTPRAALLLVKNGYQADHYLEAFRAGAAPEAIASGPEYMCIVRHAHKVCRHRLEAAEYAVLVQLMQGTPLGEALERGLAYMDPEQLIGSLPGYLRRWLNSGFFAAS